MKRGMKGLTTIGTALAAASIAAAPVMAHAFDSDTDVLAFVGATTSLWPVQLVGGTGAYEFSTIACAGVSTDTTPPEAALCSITSAGNYVNTVCGTGTADSTSTTVNEPDGADTTVSYHIQFVSGIGILTGPGAGPVNGVPPVAAVVLVPTGPGTPPNCVTSFDVVAAGVLN